MADDDKRKIVESLMKAKLQEDGAEKARGYVEMPDVLLPEEEVESGASKRELQARMQRLAMMGAVGMGTTAMGAGIRDVGLTISTAKSEFGDGRIDVKSIARKAESIAPKNVPRETARYLRSSSGEWSPSSPGPHRKTPLEGHASRRSNSVTSQGSEGHKSPTNRRASSAILAKAASGSEEHAEKAAAEPEHPRLEKSHSTASSTDERAPTPASPSSSAGATVSSFRSPIVSTKNSLDEARSTKSPTLSPKSPARVQVGASFVPKQQGFSVGAPAVSLARPSASSSDSEKAKSPSGLGAPRTVPVEPFKNFTSTTKSFAQAASSASPSIPKPGAATASPSKPLMKPAILTAPVSSPIIATRVIGNAKAPGSIPVRAPAEKPVVTAPVEEIDTDPNRKFTLEELQKGTPEGVNANKKEDYLKVSAFRKQFGCDPEAFAKYPDWKKVNLRKEAKLF